MAICTTNIYAQTTLNVGDVAFISAMMHNSSADTFAIVVLKDIDANTQIGFTDGCYKDANGFNVLTSNKNEWYFVWQAPVGGLKRGETVKYWNSLAITLNAGGAAMCDKGTIVAGDALSLNHNGGTDQIFAWQGISNLDLVNYRLTVDRYLAGIHLNYIANTTSDANWDGVASATGLFQSELPDALVNGVSAIRLDSLNVKRTNAYMEQKELSLDKTVLNNKKYWKATSKLPTRGAVLPKSIWAGSWSGGTPTSTQNVIIRSNSTIGTFSAKDVRIDPGYDFTMTSGTVANVYNDFYNYGTLSSTGDIQFFNASDTADIYGDTVKHRGIIRVASAAVLRTNNLLTLHASSDVQYGQVGSGGSYNGKNVGSLTVSYYISGGGSGYRHLCSPLSGATLAEINDDVALNFGTPSSLFQNVYQFDECGVSPHWHPGTGLSQSMDDGGFAVFIKADQLPLTIDITGTYFGTDNYVVTGLTETGSFADTSGWHFIRNPWPSGYYWDGSVSNVQGTASYIWDQTSGVYTVFDNINDGIIPPYASLLVKVTSNNVSVTLPNSSRNIALATNYFNKTVAAQNYIHISLTNAASGVTDEVNFITNISAANGFDEFDGFKLMNRADAPSLYFFENGNKLYKSVYNSIPETGAHLPLHVATNSYGFYILESNMQNFESGTFALVEDFKVNKTYELGADPIEIEIAEGDDPDRFMLHLFKNEADKPQQQNYIIQANKASLTISALQDELVQVNVVDNIGRILFAKKVAVIAGEIVEIPLQGTTVNFCVVSVIGENTMSVEKVVLIN